MIVVNNKSVNTDPNSVGRSNMYMASNTTASVTTGTYYFSGASGLAMRTTIGGLGMRPTRKCRIIGASFTRFIASTLGDRSMELFIRINNTTDYSIQAQAGTAVETFFNNTSLNIPFDVTDSAVIKLVVSGGATNSANVVFFGNILTS